MKKTEPLIGGHVSVAGGLSNAFANAQNIGADCFQIFGSSPRQWKTRMPNKEEVKHFLEQRDKTKITTYVLHSSYLANLASPIPDLRKKSVQNLSEHLKIAELIEAKGLIFHVGSGKGMSEEKAVKYVAQGIMQILKNVPGKSHIIMENTAGGGNRLGGVDDMQKIFEAVSWHKRVSACVDTAHAFESGILNYKSKKEVKEFFDEWEDRIGLDHLSFIHLNDSKTAFGSKNDRHENIGAGQIGLQGFKHLAAEKRLINIPWILEVPGFDNTGPDKKNIKLARSLF